MGTQVTDMETGARIPVPITNCDCQQFGDVLLGSCVSTTDNVLLVRTSIWTKYDLTELASL